MAACVGAHIGGHGWREREVGDGRAFNFSAPPCARFALRDGGARRERVKPEREVGNYQTTPCTHLHVQATLQKRTPKPTTKSETKISFLDMNIPPLIGP